VVRRVVQRHMEVAAVLDPTGSKEEEGMWASSEPKGHWAGLW
jgi:hypothetical protein